MLIILVLNEELKIFWVQILTQNWDADQQQLFMTGDIFVYKSSNVIWCVLHFCFSFMESLFKLLNVFKYI